MTVKTGTETGQETIWQKIYRWGKRLDEAVDYDPAEHSLNTLRSFQQRVADLEAEVVHLKGQSQPLQTGGELPPTGSSQIRS